MFAYVISGSAGLHLESVGNYATYLWIPTGISIAAFTIWGSSIWPAVALAALIVNLRIGAPPFSALGIALGNTLEGFVAASILKRDAQFSLPLRRYQDIVRLIFVAAPIGTLISPTIAMLSLYLSGALPREMVQITWIAWWIGDLLGALVVAPFILSWVGKRRPIFIRRRMPEVVGLWISLGVVCWIVFLSRITSSNPNHTLTFAAFPFIIYTALRFSMSEVTAVTFAISSAAIAGTLLQRGPFAGLSIHVALYYLDSFMAVAAATGMILDSSIREHVITAETEKIRKSQKMLAQAERLTHMGSWEWRVGTDQITWSDELYNVYGVEPEKFDRTFDSFLHLLHPEDRARIRESVEKTLRTGNSFHQDEHVIRSDGSVRVLDSHAMAIRDEHGQVERLVGTCRDVTEFKKLEAERNQALVREMKARQEAEAASRAKDLFLATLSHELRTPLTTILAWSQLIKLGTLSREKLLRGATMIEQCAKSQQQMINDLLDVSRIIMGKLSPEIQPLDPCAITLLALESVRPQAEQKGIQISSDVSACRGLIAGDQNRIQQILWNLLTNAIRFTDKGGTIRITAETIAEESQEWIRISVTDTGRGIAPEFLPRLFEPFVQADSSSTRAQGGLGIGLSIVKRLTDLHNGRVSASSAGIGKGATFRVEFPRLRAAELRPKLRPPVPLSPRPFSILSGLHILLVDDDPGANEAVSESLRSHGAQVETALSAREAMEKLLAATFDVLISDIAMPEEDGYSLIRKIRKLPDPNKCRIPAMALSAYGTAEDRMKSFECGYQLHLAKPADIETLIQKVARLARPQESAVA
ncbi:MAG: MASE1 domain-containing protein [Bdellovibrionota bacterium]